MFPLIAGATSRGPFPRPHNFSTALILEGHSEHSGERGLFEIA